MADLKNFNFKAVNAKALQSYKEKLKEFKTWAQVKSPKSLRPALSYTLGWLSPELLGTGFRMKELSDFEMKGTIPYDSTNLDGNNELHQGLVINAALELTRALLNRHITESFYKISSSEIKISKKQKWNDTLNIVLKTDGATLDTFFADLQQNKKPQIQFFVRIEVDSTKKADAVELKLVCEAMNLLT